MRVSPASLLWPGCPAERWQFAARGSETMLSSYQISMWTLKPHIKTGCNCMFVVKLPIQLPKREDPWLKWEKSLSQPLLPQPQCTAMFVKTERSSRSDDHYPSLAVVPGHQLHRDGLAVTVPLELAVPAGSSGTWQWARAAISKGHYPAHRPGGLILG